MFDSVLVPLDGSLLAECVLPHAIAFAQAFHAKVTLLRVLDKRQGVDAKVFDLLNWQIAKADAKIYLEKVAERLKEAGVDTVEVVLEGMAAESINEYAQSHKMKLIILSSHGHAGLSQWGISSVTQKNYLQCSNLGHADSCPSAGHRRVGSQGTALPAGDGSARWVVAG